MTGNSNLSSEEEIIEERNIVEKRIDSLIDASHTSHSVFIEEELIKLKGDIYVLYKKALSLQRQENEDGLDIHMNIEAKEKIIGIAYRKGWDAGIIEGKANFDDLYDSFVEEKSKWEQDTSKILASLQEKIFAWIDKRECYEGYDKYTEDENKEIKEEISKIFKEMGQ